MQLTSKLIKPLITIITTSTILSACNTITNCENTESSSVASSQSAIDTYINIAEHNYQDSLTTAQTLNNAVDTFLDAPSEETLAQTKQAWIDARAPYQQTEVYRFGNEAVDAWEGKVNAWPLDEGLIDYVDANYGSESDENPFYNANIIANPTP